MWRGVKQGVLVVLFTAVLLFSITITANAQVSLTTKTGALADGATYLIQVPSNWNCTLFLYSHGYVVPGSANPAQDVGDPVTAGPYPRPFDSLAALCPKGASHGCPFAFFLQH